MKVRMTIEYVEGDEQEPLPDPMVFLFDSVEVQQTRGLRYSQGSFSPDNRVVTVVTGKSIGRSPREGDHHDGD